MHPHHAVFLHAIESTAKLEIVFFSKEDGRQISRLCAPMDYGPSRRAHNKADRYHFWDYDSDSGQHVLSLVPSQIVQMALAGQRFDPGEFVAWSTAWCVSRDWGRYS